RNLGYRNLHSTKTVGECRSSARPELSTTQLLAARSEILYAMANVRRELPTPDPVETATKAIELLRAWQCDGVLHLTMTDGLPANLAGCALLLADIVRIIARAEDLHPQRPAVQAVQELKHYLFAYLRPEPQEIPPDAPLLITYSDFIRLFH